MLSEEERHKIYDLLPENMTIWSSDEEIEQGAGGDLMWWMEGLNHPPQSPTHRCCASCGCAITCTAGAFHEAVVDSVLRELSKLGLLRRPT